MFGKKKKIAKGKKLEEKKGTTELKKINSPQTQPLMQQRAPQIQIVPIGEAIPIQYVENFFRYFINPALTEAKVEKKTAANLKDQRGVPLAWVFAIAIVFIAGGIAYMLVMGASSNSTCQQDLAAIARTNARVVNNPAASPPPENVGGTIIR